MADKKGDKKKEEGPAPKNPFKEVLAWAIGLGIVGYLIRSGIEFFQSTGDFNSYVVANTGGPDGWYAQVLIFWDGFVILYTQLATIVSAILILAIAYASMRLRQLRKSEKKKDEAMVKQSKIQDSVQANAKWEKILDHVNSDNAAQWRLSILEADVLLEELLSSKNFRGDTLGEKLKNADPTSFKTLQAAWEAHKIRNAIAHEGSDFLVNQREAKRVIDLYERVFKEFDFV